jgi:glutamate/tyrosine decarboxylase-like PLP-dependent enzyme
VAKYLDESPYYELLNPSPPSSEDRDIIPLNIVLFRSSPKSPYPPTNPNGNDDLTKAINDTRKMYVTSTRWRGEGAVRLAVSNWQTGVTDPEGVDENLEIVKSVLEEVGRGGE